MRNKIFTAMGSLLLILLAVSVMPALAQETTEEAVAPATLLEALDLDVCEDYIGAAQIAASGSAGDDTTVAPIVPEGAETHSVLVFDLSAVAHGDVMTLLRFESKDSVAAKAEELPLVALDALDADADASLFGWIVIYFDADGNALCRSTGYPAVSGDEAPLEIVSLQGFIAQLVSETQLDAGNFQPGEFCTFETPQYCDAIFIGDARDELIEGSESGDLISGEGGSDTINARGGNDAVDGGSGNDVIDGGGGDDVIIGGDGDDVIRGGDGDDVIGGGEGDDFIGGDGGVDTLSGDNGVDTVEQD